MKSRLANSFVETITPTVVASIKSDISEFQDIFDQVRSNIEGLGNGESFEHDLHYFGERELLQRTRDIREQVDEYDRVMKRRPTLAKLKDAEKSTMMAAIKLKTMKSFNNNQIAIGEEIESPHGSHPSLNAPVATVVGTKRSPPVQSKHIDLSEFDDYTLEEIEIEHQYYKDKRDLLQADIALIPEINKELPELVEQARICLKKSELLVSFFNKTKKSTFHRVIGNRSKFRYTISRDIEDRKDIEHFVTHLIRMYKEYLTEHSAAHSNHRTRKILR